MASKPPVSRHQAHSNNYEQSARESSDIDGIVVHVTQGSWSSTVNWFQHPDAYVSAHYVVRSRDGETAQCVSDRDVAYHAGNYGYNTASIGIEHEGYVDDPSWFTEEMFRSSARLAAFLCKKWDIPIDRDYIIGHNEVRGSDHTDPGRHWWWDRYMDLIRRYSA